MSSTDREQPVTVDVGPCRCPGTPHATDTVTLAPRPPLRLGLAAEAAIGQADDLIGLQAMLGAVFIRYGVIGWNLVDDKGKPLDLSPSAVEDRLTWDRGGKDVADAAAELYTDTVVTPLVAKMSISPAPGLTASSTSPIQPLPLPALGSSTPSSPANSERTP